MLKALNGKGSVLITAVVLLLLLFIISLAFSFWLNTQSKNSAHKKMSARAQFYNEAALQCMTRYIQNDLTASAKLTDNVTTDVFILKLIMPDGTNVEVSTWDIP